MEKTIIYTDRMAVIREVFALMQSVLSCRDRAILLTRCGYYDECPPTYGEISDRFRLDGSAHASLCCRHAIAALRRAIPHSPLAAYLRRFPAEWQT